jgi:hypothetical protein
VLRTLLSCALFSALSLPARAATTVTATETVIRLTVSPMPAPKPALRYSLLPELKEMSPGNPIPNYLKCLLDQDYSTDQEVLSQAALRQADRAARMDKPDWQVLPKIKTDGVNLLLPDVQKVRTLATALQGRFRDEIALRRFDDALVTAKTMFAMSRHMGEHPTLIGGLVGMAIAFVTIAPLEEMLEQPGCPNLFWALTNLPCPLVTMDKGMAGERLFILAELRDLDDRTPMTPDQLKKLIVHIDKLRDLGQKPDKSTRAWLDERTKDEKYLTAARRRLVEYGLVEERVARFPADQVLLLDEKRDFECQRDEALKFMNLPTWETIGLLDKLQKVQPAKESVLFEGFLPAIQKIRRAQGRLEQRIALLRHVEALRLYAAGHDGKLPDKLDAIDVPLPVDPFTGKPFRYELKDGTAHLRGSPPPGDEKNPAYNIHYEITVRK